MKIRFINYFSTPSTSHVIFFQVIIQSSHPKTAVMSDKPTTGITATTSEDFIIPKSFITCAFNIKVDYEFVLYQRLFQFTCLNWLEDNRLRRED